MKGLPKTDRNLGGITEPCRHLGRHPLRETFIGFFGLNRVIDEPERWTERDPWRTTEQVAFGSFGPVQSRPIDLAGGLGTGKKSGGFVSKSSIEVHTCCRRSG